MTIMHIISIIADRCLVKWLEFVGSLVVYELLYVVPIQNILGKLPLVPVGDTGTIPHCRVEAGRRRWMQDVVCQLVGIGMVP